MEIDFEAHQQSILSYIENNYKTFIGTMEEPDNYINDYPDLDKYKSAVNLFIDFEDYIFEPLSNESDLMTLKMNVYISIKQDTSYNLRLKILRYTKAFMNMFDAKHGLGTCDDGKVNGVHFYDNVEGASNTRVVSISIEMIQEV